MCTSCVLLTRDPDQSESSLATDHWTDQSPGLPLVRCQDTRDRVLNGEGISSDQFQLILKVSNGTHCSANYDYWLHWLWIKKMQTIIWPFPVFRFRLGMFLVKAGETWYRRSVSVSLPWPDLQNTLSSIDQCLSHESAKWKSELWWENW